MRIPRGTIVLVLASGLAVLPAAGAKKKPCFEPLGKCPLRGCAAKDSPDALSNRLKRNRNPQTPLKTLTLADFQRLQALVETRFDHAYSTLAKSDRARLRKFTLGALTVGEGDLVEVLGYIAVKPTGSKPHANTSGESVNCRIPKAVNNDFHISLTAQPSGSEFAGIVVEMIPQQRPEEWTEGHLKQVQKANAMVRVRGQLLFDNHHVVNDDPDAPVGKQPKRMSLWEVHPVTGFDVCTQTTCTADGDGWKPLSDWP